MEQFYQMILQLIDVWGYSAIIVLMALENACLPVPSELVFGFAGYLVFLGRMDFTLAVSAGIVGGLLGSLLAYTVGFYGGRPCINKYGRYIFLSQHHVNLAQQWFDRYGVKAVFFSRLLPVVRTFISLPAGFAQVDFKKFIIYTVLGSALWTVAIIYAGMLLGTHWSNIRAVGHSAGVFIGVVLVLIGVWWLWRNKDSGK